MTQELREVVALHFINGKIEPGTMFTPDDIEQQTELFTLKAIRDLNDAERDVAERIAAARAGTDVAPKPAAGARGKGKPKTDAADSAFDDL